MGDPDAVQLLVLQQRLHGWVVEGLDLPAPGRSDLDPGLGEGLDHIGGQIRPHPSPEGDGHLVRQLGQPPRLTASGIPIAQQFVQHLPVHPGAPGQPRAVHLGGDQHPRRLGGGEQAHPVGVGGGVVAALLLGVDREQVGEGEVDALRFEEGGLRARFGGALRRVRWHGPAP